MTFPFICFFGAYCDFCEDLHTCLALLQVITMVAHSSEFENIVVREEEQDELENLARKACPLEVKGGPTDKHGKISILIQVTVEELLLSC
jgi:hypothetical protein